MIEIKDRVRNSALQAKITTAEAAAALIKPGMNLGVSGFTPAGYPKAVPLALAERMKANPFQVNLWTGASVGKELDVLGVVVDEAVAKVSIVGAGMLGSPGMAARMFGALSAAGINIEVISTSEISVSCLVREERAKDAVNAIHAAFFRDDKSRL